MSRYTETFARLREKGEMAFVPFWMMGYPNQEASLQKLELLAEHADILEIGCPFSDPLADGPTIQRVANQALASGATMCKTFEGIAAFRKKSEKFSTLPIGLLVYLNLMLSFGVENFFKRAKEVEIDSVLIPEMPSGELGLVQNFADKYEIDVIFLVSTNTPQERQDDILSKAHGFLYCISTPSVTGAKSEIAPETLQMIGDLKQKTDIPLCVGFGVSSPEHIQTLKGSGADGAIVGSKLFEFKTDAALSAFCAQCKAATR